MFTECLRVFCGILKGVSRKFQESFKDVSRKFSRVFQGRLKGVSR